MANAQNLMGVGFSGAAATYLATEIASPADAGSPGAVTMQPAIPDVSGTSPTKAEFNSLLAALRLAGVLET